MMPYESISVPSKSQINVGFIILTIARFNFLKFFGIIILTFIVQGLKVALVFYKRKIIKLFFNREQNKIEEYSAGKFRYLLYNKIISSLLGGVMRKSIVLLGIFLLFYTAVGFAANSFSFSV